MLPGCCHIHISANSVPYLKPQKRKVESGFWHGQKLISTKRKRGRKKVAKEVPWQDGGVESSTCIECDPQSERRVTHNSFEKGFSALQTH